MSASAPMPILDYEALPERVLGLAGRINDVDGHEAIPRYQWGEAFGSPGREFNEAMVASSFGYIPPPIEDDKVIDHDTAWKLKRSDAPSAIDLSRRLDLLDFVGTDKQILFPGDFGLMAAMLYARADDPTFISAIRGDRRSEARRFAAAHNDWCAEFPRWTDRIRPVALLVAPDVEGLLAETRRLLAKGVRAFWTPTASPPAGKSPAHPDLDPLWAMIADADAVLLAHIGADEGFLATTAWRDTPMFANWKLGGEFPCDPWTMGHNHLATANFLSCLVLGGVFDRVPHLRFGAMELGAHWLGPLAETMDLWYDNRSMFMTAETMLLKRRPSEYLRSNVRVSAFDVEDVGSYFARYDLDDCFCYGSDFPHPEGGKQPIRRFAESLANQDDDILRKFFVENARLIIPA
jgi:predicted TIM-barrel fold metal-dependent hydrolase